MTKFSLGVVCILCWPFLAYAEPVDVVITGQEKTERVVEKLPVSTTTQITDIFPVAEQTPVALLRPSHPHAGVPLQAPVVLKSHQPLAPYLPVIPSRQIAVFYPSHRQDISFWNLKVVDSQGQVVWEQRSKAAPPETIAWDGTDTKGKRRLVAVGETYSFVYEAKVSGQVGMIREGQVFEVPALLEESETLTLISLSQKALFDSDQMSSPGRFWLRAACDEIKKHPYSSLKVIWVSDQNNSLSLETVRTFLAQELLLESEQVQTLEEKTSQVPVVKILLEKGKTPT